MRKGKTRGFRSESGGDRDGPGSSRRYRREKKETQVEKHRVGRRTGLGDRRAEEEEREAGDGTVLRSGRLAFCLEGSKAETIRRGIFWRRSGHRPVPALRGAHTSWERGAGLPSAAPAGRSQVAGPRLPAAGASVHSPSLGAEKQLRAWPTSCSHTPPQSAAPGCSETAVAQRGGIRGKVLLEGHL